MRVIGALTEETTEGSLPLLSCAERTTVYEPGSRPRQTAQHLHRQEHEK